MLSEFLEAVRDMRLATWVRITSEFDAYTLSKSESALGALLTPGSPPLSRRIFHFATNASPAGRLEMLGLLFDLSELPVREELMGIIFPEKRKLEIKEMVSLLSRDTLNHLLDLVSHTDLLGSANAKEEVVAAEAKIDQVFWEKVRNKPEDGSMRYVEEIINADPEKMRVLAEIQKLGPISLIETENGLAFINANPIHLTIQEVSKKISEGIPLANFEQLDAIKECLGEEFGKATSQKGNLFYIARDKSIGVCFCSKSQSKKGKLQLMEIDINLVPGTSVGAYFMLGLEVD